MHLIILIFVIGGVFTPINTAQPLTPANFATPAITATRDCSPKIDYKTEAEELEFCKLVDQNPNCIIYEDFSTTCK